MRALAGVWPQAQLAAFVLAGTLATTAAMCKLAPRIGLLAHPNARSSHAKPTPTAGGIGFVLPSLAVFALLAPEHPPSATLLVAGLAITVLGLVDDALDVYRSVRLACHVLLITGSVLWLFHPGLLAGVIFAIGLAWWLNLYNFMDGIDGIAASQAVAYAGGVLALGHADGSTPMLWALLAASAGFLCFNWPPARIFMGDAGAGFLGLVIGVTALWLWQSDEFPIAASAILLLTFWFDATYTLIVRVVTGQAFADAHRTHLYQIVARHLGHGLAVALFWLHFLAWLLPLAALSVALPEWRLVILAVAAVPLACACARFRAGARESDATTSGYDGTSHAG